MAENQSNKKVAVIGCGPSGIMVLSAFAEAVKRGEQIPEVVGFEKQNQISGLWNYTWRTGLTEHGDALPNSMYRHLWSNGPKECLELPDYTFDDHFKKPIPSFPPRAVLQDYLLGKAKKSGIDQFVLLDTVVRNVEEKGEQFLVTYECLKTKKTFFKIFDYVIVATGHYTVPHFPSYPGIETFNGRVMHAHDFRMSEEFKDKTVLLIGSSYSAEDISLQCYKYGSKQCIISYRRSPMGYKWPEGIKEKPGLIRVEGDTFHFVDGTSERADDVIFCTGYKHFFPFMTENLRLYATNIMYPDHLYKGVVFNKNPRCLYMAMQDQYYTYTMFDSQGLWARDYCMGKIPEAGVVEREVDIKKWYDRGQALKTATDEIIFQRDYVRDLVKDIAGYPKHHDIDMIADHLLEWKKHKAADIIAYRDHCFKSPNTGTMAIDHSVPWIKAFDDSLDGYINQKERVSPA